MQNYRTSDLDRVGDYGKTDPLFWSRLRTQEFYETKIKGRPSDFRVKTHAEMVLKEINEASMDSKRDISVNVELLKKKEATGCCPVGGIPNLPCVISV